MKRRIGISIGTVLVLLCWGATPVQAQQNLDSITITQLETGVAAHKSGFGVSSKHAILQVQFHISGSGQAVQIEQITVHARNSDTTNDDVNGVRILYEAGGDFTTATDISLVGAPHTFSANQVVIDVTDTDLDDNGMLWIVYDVESAPTSATGNTLDACLLRGSIETTDPDLFPARNADPPGERKIFIPDYYVNDNDTTGNLLCSAAGVDDNNASRGLQPDMPYASFAKLVERRNLNGGDIVLIDEGTYDINTLPTAGQWIIDDQGVGNSDDGGTDAANRLIIRGALDQISGTRQTIVEDTGGGNNQRIFLIQNGADFVTLMDMEIRNGKGVNGTGIEITNNAGGAPLTQPTNAQIINCWIHSNNRNGISITDPEGPTTGDHLIKNCQIDSNGGDANSIGILINRQTGCVIEDCEIFGNGVNATPGKDGIQVNNNSTGTRILDCKIYSNQRHGIIIANSSSAAPPNDSIIVGCEIYDHPDSGDRGVWVLTTSTNVLVQNCLLFQNFEAIRYDNSNAGLALNNTVHIDVDVDLAAGFQIANGSVNWTNKHNIFLIDGPSGGNTVFGIDVDVSVGGGDTSDYNTYFRTGTTGNAFVGRRAGSPKQEFAADWQNEGGAYDPNSTDLDPSFKNAAGRDYHVESPGGRFNPLLSPPAYEYADTNTGNGIDAGDTATSPDGESENNGNIINHGAYGGTEEGAKTDNTIVMFDAGDGPNILNEETSGELTQGFGGKLNPTEIVMQVKIPGGGNFTGDPANFVIVYTNDGSTPSATNGSRTRTLTGGTPGGAPYATRIPAFDVGTTVKFIVLMDGKPYTDAGGAYWEYDVDDVNGGANQPPGKPNMLLLFDNARFKIAQPTLRFRAFDPEGDGLAYQVQIDTDTAFITPFNADDTSDMGGTPFTNVDGPETPPSEFPSGDRIQHLIGSSLTTGTYYWRVRAKDPSGANLFGPWSEVRSFRVNTGLPGPPYTSEYASWFQDTQDQLNTNLLLGTETTGPGIARLQAGLVRGRILTRLISLRAQDVRPTVSMAQWGLVRVTGTHPNNAGNDTTVRVSVLSPFQDGPIQVAESINDNTSFNLTLNNIPGFLLSCPELIIIEVTLERQNAGDSSPQVDTLLAEAENSLGGTTAVTLTGLTSTPYDGEALIEWQTGAELQNLGFNVYRSEYPDRDFAQINATLVAGLGDDVAGGRYYFHDQTAQNGKTYYYKIEDVDMGGRLTVHGPVSVTPQVGLGTATVNPALYVNGGINDGGAGQPTGAAANPDGSATAEYGHEPRGVTITNSGPTGFNIRIEVPRFTRGAAAPWDLVAIDGYSPSTDIDRPVLPTRNVLIEIPPAATAALSNITTTPETHGGYDLPANLINPTPPPPTVLGAVPPSHDGSLIWPSAALQVNGIIQLGDRTLLSLRVDPVGAITDTQTIQYSPTIAARVDLGPPPPPPPGAGAAEAVQSQLVTSQGVLAITVVADGVYRLTKADLDAAGFDTGSDPRLWTLYNLGQAIPIRIEGEQDGIFDPSDALELFGQRNTTRYLGSTQTRFTDSNTYYLAVGVTSGPRIPDVDVQPIVTSLRPFERYTAAVRREQQQLVRRWPFMEGEDHWFMDRLVGGGGSAQVTHTLSLWAVAPPLDSAVLRYRLRGATFDPDNDPDHTVQLSLNGVPLTTVTFDGQSELTGEVAAPNVQPGDNDVTVQVLGGSSDSVMVDWLEIGYPRRFISEDRASLRFTQAQAGLHRVENFASNAVEVWDLSDPRQPRRLVNGTVTDADDIVGPGGAHTAGPSFQVAFDTTTNELGAAPVRDILVLTPVAKRTPVLVLHSPTQDLRSPTQGADYIVIADRSLQDAADRLAAYRQGRGLRSTVVFVDEILDEFGFGNLDPDAITRFLSHAYTSWQLPRPKYVVLLGDGHYDYHDHIGTGAPNLVPVKMVESEFSWTAADNRYVTVSGNDALPDLLIGRLPVSDLTQANRAVDKIQAYEALAFDPAWGQRALFVADDPDEVYDFHGMAEGLISRLPATHTATRAFFPTQGPNTTVRQLIKDTINAPGALLTVYSGHGSLTLWAAEDLFSSYRVISWSPLIVENDVNDLTNVGRPTIGIVANCQSGDFSHTNPSLSVMGETWVNHDGGGAVAFWASTGFTRPLPQDLMVRHLFDLLFAENQGVLGDAVNAAKVRLMADGNHTNVIDTWVLLGDPALSIYSQNPQLAQPNPLPPQPPKGPTLPGPPPILPPGQRPPPPGPTSGGLKIFGVGVGCGLAADRSSTPPWPMLLVLVLLVFLRARSRRA